MSRSDGSSLLEQVDAFIREHELLEPGARVVVGLSGGVDSIVLAQVLHRLGFEPVAAHVNYGLRGTASEADEAFIRDWCAAQTPTLDLHVTRLDAKKRAEAEGESLQEAARLLRYAYFAEQARRVGLQRVAVGHHLDDQAETLLLNLFRGSGIEGLAGMAPQRPFQSDPSITLVRPLLTVRRSDIEAYAEASKLAWRTDASNERLKYDRNVIRQAILPVIEAHFEGATDRLANTAALVRAYAEHTLQPELEKRFAACAEPAVRGGRLLLEPLREQPVVWRRRLILEALRRWLPRAPYHATLAEEVEALLDTQVGRRVEVTGGSIWRERGHLLVLSSEGAEEVPDARPVPWDGAVELPGGTLRVEPVDGRPRMLDTGTPHAVYLDADALSGGLTVRTWRAGDRLQPLGMEGTKKVSDLLTDAQVPAHRRASTLVVCDERRIVWVVGLRLAHPVRVRPDTNRCVRLVYQPRDTGPETG